MTQNKRIIGITGGSGCGKSHICARLAARGMTAVDCDVVAREIMKPGRACLSETVEAFGEDILENGVLNRKKLAKLVFSDKEKLAELNRITHKYILEDIYNRIEQAESGIVLIDGAVLIESGIVCDKLIGVLADKAVRKKRIMERDGLSEEEAERRINAQQPDSFYLENCDLVIYNSGGEVDIDAVIKRIEE